MERFQDDAGYDNFAAGMVAGSIPTGVGCALCERGVVRIKMKRGYLHREGTRNLRCERP